MIDEEKYLKIEGRNGIKIYFDCDNPDLLLEDKSLFGMSDKEKKQAVKKPFIVSDKFFVLVDYDNKYCGFTIPKGYDWDGANVPPFAWWIIGQQKEPRFKLASCVHDYICEHHQVVANNRYLSTLIFETICQHFGGFGEVKRAIMFNCVDNYQKVFGGW